MVQRLFLDRVDAESARPAVADELDLVVDALPHVTQAALTVAQTAVARAQIALQSAVIDAMPVVGRNDSRVHDLFNRAESLTYQVEEHAALLYRRKNR